MTTLIDFADPRTEGAARLRLAFGTPSRVLSARTPEEVRPVLEAVEALAREGRWCVGFLRYEAAEAFDPAFAVHRGEGPLAWFGVHDEVQPWPMDDSPAPTVDWQPTLSRADFDRRMRAIHRAIANGELYQINYTAALETEFRGDARAWFMELLRAQPNGYAAFIDTGEEQVLSVSPELFFDWHGDSILSRPMKGTAPRGATVEEDEALAQRLRTVPKERAENVMIVDLIRNDLSRVARPFSVRVPRLFHTEALPTVWQMTSDVEATVREGVSLADMFAALFPCGSITGAPKVSAMRLIRELEPEARGVYCGAVGVVRPGGHATFNVPIRTVTVTVRGTAARCGIGSGITADARADAEWEEWAHKRAFLMQGRPMPTDQPSTNEDMDSSFELLETLALVDSALRDAPAHLARMAGAAAHFAYPWDEARVSACLDTLVQAHAAGSWRVRLLLDAQGQPRAEAFAMGAAPARVRLQLAAHPFAEADSEFSRFKTTHRAHYEAAAPADPEVFDTLLWNRRGEITECTRGNIALQLEDGRWVTPPLRCGLLGGIGRARRLREGQLTEAVVRVDALPRVRALAFVNSLRGWLDADLR